MRKTGFRLFDIAGFDIRLDESWLPVAILMVWTLSHDTFPPEILGRSAWLPVAMAVFVTVTFFLGLVLHELAHALVARRFGLSVGGITLYAFGGIAELTEEPHDAWSEFWIALAGPVVSGLLALAFAGVAGLQGSAVVRVMAAQLALMNSSVTLFNLMPAYPLDGGRLLRAALWGLWRDRDRATLAAAFGGIVLGWFQLLAGLFLLFGARNSEGLWLILIGTILLTLARGTQEEVRLRRDLGGRRVSASMTADPAFARPEAALSDVVDRLILGRGCSFLPVVSGEDFLVGTVDVAAIRRVERDLWPVTAIHQIMEPLGPDSMVGPDAFCDAVLHRMLSTGRRKMAVARDGHLVGVIALSDLMDFAWLAEGLADRRSTGAAGGKAGGPRQPAQA